MRSVVSAARAAVPALLLLVVFAVPAAASAQDRTEARIVRAMNKARARHHLPRLHSNVALARAANAHSGAMARTGQISHGAFEQRLRRYVRARTIGENLAWARRCSSAQIVRMWLASPPHRAIMLSRSFRRVGVGRSTGRNLCLVTADFASAK